MTWEFVGQCVLGALIIGGWIAAGYSAVNRDYQRKLRRQRDAELAAMQAAGKQSNNFQSIDLRT